MRKVLFFYLLEVKIVSGGSHMFVYVNKGLEVLDLAFFFAGRRLIPLDQAVVNWLYVLHLRLIIIFNDL